MRTLLLVALALILVPRTPDASSHVEVGVQCDGPVPLLVAVKMRRADTVTIPLALMFQFCAQEHDDAEGKPS